MLSDSRTRPQGPQPFEAPLLELRLEPGLLVPRKALWGAAALSSLGLGVSVSWLEQSLPLIPSEQVFLWTFGVAGALLYTLALATRSMKRSGPVAAIRVERERLVVPRRAGSHRTFDVPYRDVLSLEVIGGAARGTLVLNTRQRLLSYPLESLEEPALCDELRARVRDRVKALPDGETLLTRLDRREALGRDTRLRPIRVTWMLCVLLAAVFAVVQLIGAASRPLGLLHYGANAPALVFAGQLERLFAASFLHGNVFHMVANWISVLVLGVVLERLLGAWRFTAIYLGSALAGALASAAWSRAAYSVGASSAVFGLLGALAWLHWRLDSELPAGFRQAPRWWAFILTLNVALMVFVPELDVAAHVGGFIGGVALALLSCQQDVLRTSARRGVRIAAWALAGAHALALLQTVRRAAASPVETRAAFARTSLGSSTDADILCAITWTSAIEPAATAEELDLARRAGERGLELAPNSDDLTDSLATVYYRLGDFDRAVALEREVHARRPSVEFFSAQIARFLGARRSSSPLRLGPQNEPPGPILELEREHGPGGARLLVTARRSLERGAVVWLLERSGDQLSGYWIVKVGPIGPGERASSAEPLRSERLDALRLEPALIDTHGCGDCMPQSVARRYLVMDPVALALP